MAGNQNSGRPRTTVDKLPDNWRDILLAVGKDGGSIAEMVAAIGLTQTSWTTLKKDDQEFSDYVDDCLLHAQVWWEKHGRKMASGQAEGNAPTWIFNMKNRFGWADKVQQELTGKDGQPIQQAITIKVEFDDDSEVQP
jgi:hypothetical protein